jgi:hypothetical protein
MKTVAGSVFGEGDEDFGQGDEDNRGYSDGSLCEAVAAKVPLLDEYYGCECSPGEDGGRQRLWRRR